MSIPGQLSSTAVKGLWAFWEYDQFPFVLGDAISRINQHGWVYADSYRGWFKPVLIVPQEDGERLREIIESARKTYCQRTSELQAELERGFLIDTQRLFERKESK